MTPKRALEWFFDHEDEYHQSAEEHSAYMCAIDALIAYIEKEDDCK